MQRQLIYRDNGKPAFLISLLKNDEKGNYYIESNLPIVLIDEINSVINKHKEEGIQYNPVNFERTAQEIAESIFKSKTARAFFFNDFFIGSENQLDSAMVEQLWNAHDYILSSQIKYVTMNINPAVCFYLKMVANFGRFRLNKFISFEEISREKFEKRFVQEEHKRNYIELFSECAAFIKVISDVDERPSFIAALNESGDVLIAHIM